MLQKVGKRISTTRQTSATKHYAAELQKRHTEGELEELQNLHSSRKPRKRVTSSATSDELL